MGQAVAYESVAKRTKLTQEIEAMERQSLRADAEIESGLVDAQSFSHDQISDKQGFMARLATKKKRLALITPPSLAEMNDKGVKDKKLRARASQLADVWVNGTGKFPRARSREEMEQCPAGADDMNRLHHQLISHHNVTADGELVKVNHKKAQYPLYVELKNLLRIINSDSEEELDGSVSNLELLRPDRVEDKDSLLNFRARTYASPARNLTAQEYEKRIGIESLNPIQLSIHEAEKAGVIKPPTMEDHFQRMFGEGNSKAEAKVDNGSLGENEPIHTGANNWVLATGITFRGSRKEARKRTLEMKDEE
jgi:hypothetical protein